MSTRKGECGTSRSTTRGSGTEDGSYGSGSAGRSRGDYVSAGLKQMVKLRLRTNGLRVPFMPALLIALLAGIAQSSEADEYCEGAKVLTRPETQAEWNVWAGSQSFTRV